MTFSRRWIIRSALHLACKYHISITFIQCCRPTNVEDVGPTLHKCYINVLCLLGDSCSVDKSGPVFSYKLRLIVGFWLVEMAISTNQKPTIYRNLYENTGPARIATSADQTTPLLHLSKNVYPEMLKGIQNLIYYKGGYRFKYWILPCALSYIGLSAYRTLYTNII